MAAPVGFVGREGELARLLAAVSGDTRLVLVVGDAGIGKTRFAGEGMARAAAAGAVMVRGECLPLAETLPLLPIAAALGELARVDGGGLVEAALAATPAFVREEVARLLPGLGPGGGPGPGGRDEGWQRQRLFAAVAELLDAVAEAAGCGVGLVAEDVHWADSTTLDLLTFLARGGCRGAVSVVVTCRGDEAPLDAQVAGWLAQVRGAAGVEELRLGPLSRAEVAAQAAALAGGPVPPGVVDELYARAEGNPFFTEQLVAAALAGGTGGGLGVPAGLPGRLAELLVARAGRCTGDARTVLAGLAVAARPLGEDVLGTITGLDAGAVRGGLRELAAARLLADGTPGGGHRPRHALLAEAVAGGLLPGERAAVHENLARALAAAGGQTLTGEVAGHWQAAGNPTQELPARVAAAGAAERVFGYAEAAAHWQRAIELAEAHPGAVGAAGLAVPRIYVRAIDALDLSGDGVRAGVVAEEAYRRFGDDPDPAIVGVVHHRVATFRAIETPTAALPLIKESLRLFAQTVPSAEYAEAWQDYAHTFLLQGQGQQQASHDAARRALEIAEAAGTPTLVARLLPRLAWHAFFGGHADEGFALLHRARALTEASGDSEASLAVAVTESDALLQLGRFRDAAEVALNGYRAASEVGLAAWYSTAKLAGNAAEGLLTCGRTAEAAALIDPLTIGPPDLDHWATHDSRAEIDLLRGDIDAAALRRLRMAACIGHHGNLESARLSAQRTAELALWAGRPGDALQEAPPVLARFQATDLTVFCGRLLVTGMRACADLAEGARARRDERAAETAVSAAGGLASWAGQVSSSPFAEHPFVATIPAERATWDAERARLAGASDSDAWSAAAHAWEMLGCPHRAGYAWWRQAEAQLNTGQPAKAAAAALRAAGDASEGHAPLLAQIRTLAQRAHILLHSPAPGTAESPLPAKSRVPYGLTGRELAVLRLLAAGHTNAQIGAELYMSPKTAGVHVSNILRKLEVSSRVQAATLAERAGLLAVSGAKHPTGNI